MAAAAPGLRPPPSCGLRQARARATGRRWGLERPARAPDGERCPRLPAPGWRVWNGLRFAPRRRKTAGTRPPAIESVRWQAGLPRAARGCSRTAPAAPAPELRAGGKQPPQTEPKGGREGGSGRGAEGERGRMAFGILTDGDARRHVSSSACTGTSGF